MTWCDTPIRGKGRVCHDGCSEALPSSEEQSRANDVLQDSAQTIVNWSKHVCQGLIYFVCEMVHLHDRGWMKQSLLYHEPENVRFRKEYLWLTEVRCTMIMLVTATTVIQHSDESVLRLSSFYGYTHKVCKRSRQCLNMMFSLSRISTIRSDAPSFTSIRRLLYSLSVLSPLTTLITLRSTRSSMTPKFKSFYSQYRWSYEVIEGTYRAPGYSQ